MILHVSHVLMSDSSSRHRMSSNQCFLFGGIICAWTDIFTTHVLFFLLCASAISHGGGMLSLVFVSASPGHHCLIPEVNLTEDWHVAIIPVKVVDGVEELSRCSRYRLDVVRNLSAQGFVPGRDVNLTDLEQESCVDGWSYSTDIYQSTIVSEFDLVCTDQWKQPFTSTVFFIGVAVGSFLSGQISDRFGRKPAFYVNKALQGVFTFSSIFSPSWTVFSIIVFFTGLVTIANYMAVFVLGAEIFNGKVRIMYSTLGISMGFAIGYMILPLLAYLLKDWKYLQFAISVACLLYLPLWWLIPESPRWLLSKGRVEEAEAIVRKAAHKNKVEAPQVIFEECVAFNKAACEVKHYTIFDLFGTRSIRVTTFILWLVWFTVSTGYFALSLNTSNLSFDPYVSCFISAVVEVPAYTCSWLTLQYLPRRLTTISTLSLGGVALCLTQAIPKTLPELSMTLEMLGKFAFATCFSLIFAYTAELYPTVLRNTATGTCSTFSRLGNCIAPFLFQLSVYFQSLPYILLGSLAVLTATGSQFLPESFGQALPETIEQMHQWERMKCPCVTQKKIHNSLAHQRK